MGKACIQLPIDVSRGGALIYMLTLNFFKLALELWVFTEGANPQKTRFSVRRKTHRE